MADPTQYTKVIEELEQARVYARLANSANSSYEQREQAAREQSHKARALKLLKDLP